MLVIYATIPIDPDRREDALAVVQELAVASRAEEGVVDYRVGTDVEDPSVLRFIEQYEDEDAFAAHAETEHFQTFEETIPDMLAGVPEVTRFDVESVSDVQM